MIEKKIKQLRLSRGWTLEELAAKMGGSISKQAISKYECGLSFPSPKNLLKLAQVFDVKTVYLLSEPKYEIDFIAYRKKSTLSNQDELQIQNFVRERLEDRLFVRELVRPEAFPNVPIQKYKIEHLEETEGIADDIRKKWSLGKESIASVTNVLESNFVHVMEVQADDKFDGIAAIAYKNKKVKGAAVVSRKGITGDRQKLNLTHELGHLVLKVSSSVDEEKAAFRFGGAFLAPRDWIIREVGSKRTTLKVEELLILKKKTGLSIQAIISRLKDLEIISKNYYNHCFKAICKLGWRMKEPQEIPTEDNEWLKQNVLKAYAENLIGQKQAEKLIGEKIEEKIPLNLQKIRSLMSLSLEERKKVMRSQAEQVEDYYKDSVNDDTQVGDFIDE